MADKFDKFTVRARRTLTLAQEETQRFGHNAIGTEHILLGLVREGDGIAARVLNNLGVQLPKVRAAVEFRIGRGNPSPPSEIGLTPRAKTVIELAVDEARRLNHHYIGTEHLLLGLAREGEGLAAEVLATLGVSLEKLRAQVIQLLSQSSDVGLAAALDPAAPPAVTAALRELAALRHDLDNAVRVQDLDRAVALRQRERELLTRLERLEREWLHGRGGAGGAAAATPGIDFEQFTEAARRVLALAQSEALRFNHRYIGTEHLLLGLTREPGVSAGRILAELGVQLPRVRSAVEFIIGRGEAMVMGEIGLTPRAKTALTLAVDEARHLGDLQVDSIHLLLGLAREGEGIAAGVLESMGVGFGTVRARVLRSRAGAGAAGPTVPTEHRFGRSLRAVPANLAGEERALAATLRVTLRELDAYERGFVAHLTLVLVGPWSRPPDLLATAEDDRGGVYAGIRTGGSGGDGAEGMIWRERYEFTPALDTDATALTLAFTTGRRRGATVVPDADAVTWSFTVALDTATPDAN